MIPSDIDTDPVSSLMSYVVTANRAQYAPLRNLTGGEQEAVMEVLATTWFLPLSSIPGLCLPPDVAWGQSSQWNLGSPWQTIWHSTS